VAAKQCSQCSAALKTKPIPLRLKLYAVFAGGVVLLLTIGISLLSHLADSEASLNAAVKALATKTYSPEQSTAIFVNLDHALENFLKSHSGLSREDLLKTLQAKLPSTGFEVHVFELPQKLKLVEVDFGLTVYDYLLYGSSEGVKVMPLVGLGVYDDASVISDLVQPTLVVLGHSFDGTSHIPVIKAYSLLLDRTVEQTEKVVPKLEPAKLASDSTLRFADNHKDIIVPLASATVIKRSKGGKRRVVTVVKSESKLVWRDGQYSFDATGKAPEPTTAVANESKPEQNGAKPSQTATSITAQEAPARSAILPPAVKTTSPQLAEIPASNPQKSGTANNDVASGTVTKSTKTQSQVASTTNSLKELGTGTVASAPGSAKMRSGPGTGSEVLSEVKSGTSLAILGRTDGWYKVRADGQEGYVYAGLVDYDQKNAYKTGTVKKNMKIVDDRNRLIETANTGENLVILRGSKRSKYKVQLANGKIGYLDKAAIDQISTDESPVSVVASTPSPASPSTPSSRRSSSSRRTSISSRTPAPSPADTPPPLVP
jgi:SH3-like domain-containing protein